MSYMHKFILDKNKNIIYINIQNFENIFNILSIEENRSLKSKKHLEKVADVALEKSGISNFILLVLKT